MIESQIILLSQLLGTAFGAGLNLYATVAALGLASRLGWIATLPPGLRGLDHPIVIGSAVALFLIEAVVDKLRHLDSVWDAVHTVIRPVAAGLLALGATAGLSSELRLAAALTAALVALSAHASKAGLRLAINARPIPGSARLVSVAEDVLAVAIVLVVMRFPAAALIVAGTSLTTVVLVGPLFWRAFLFGLRSFHARFRRLFEPGRWLEIDELPGDLRALVEPPPLGLAPPRAARAVVRGMRGVGAYRNGWLVIAAGAPYFVFRSVLRPRRIRLPLADAAEVRFGVWADTLEVTGRAPYTLYLLKDGPGAERARDELLETVAA